MFIAWTEELNFQGLAVVVRDAYISSRARPRRCGERFTVPLSKVEESTFRSRSVQGQDQRKKEPCLYISSKCLL